MPAEAPLSRGVVAIVLAAGRSARMGSERNKLVEEVAGRPLVAWPVDALLEAGIERVIVVTGFEAERVRAALGERLCSFVDHAGWAEGMGSSLACAVRAVLAGPTRPDAILISVGDLPGLRAEHVATVLAAARDASGRIPAERIVLPTHAGRRGHPVSFGSDWFDALAQLAGDEGARSLLRAHPDRIVEVEVADAGCLRDVDTPDDLNAARSGSGDLFGPG
ncbi:nucleotidyltransferase family protein [Myxococcota bacterium]|nr:nucleotidyltransferase family protein [Myxococcota bacterium]